MSRDYVKNQRSSRNMSHPSSSSGPSGMVWLLVGVLMGLIIAGIFYVKNQHSIPKDEAVMPNATQPTAQQPKSPTSQNAASSNENLQTQFDFYNVLPSQKIVGPSGDEDTSEINNQNDSINNPAPTNTVAPQSQNTSPDSSQQNAAQQSATQQNTNQTSTPTTNTASPSTTSTAATATTPSPSVSTNSQNNLSTTTATASTTTPNKTTHTATVANSSSTPQTTPLKDQNYILQIATFSQFTAADQLKAQLSLAGFEVNISQIQHDGKAMERVWVGPFHTQDEAAAVQKQLQDNQISSKLLKSS